MGVVVEALALPEGTLILAALLRVGVRGLVGVLVGVLAALVCLIGIARTGAALTEPGLLVLSFKFGIGQDPVGLVNLLDFGLVALVVVGVVLHGQLVICGLDLGVRGRPGYSQLLVVILLGIETSTEVKPHPPKSSQIPGSPA